MGVTVKLQEGRVSHRDHMCYCWLSLAFTIRTCKCELLLFLFDVH